MVRKMKHLKKSAKHADFRLLIVADNEATHADLKRLLRTETLEIELDDDGATVLGRSGLNNSKFETDSAFQGQEGLIRLQEARDAGKPYALAFIDIRTPPGWDAVETISHLWEVDPDLQIVICTAFTDYNWNGIEQNLGFSGNLVLLKKPFDPAEVAEVAHALTEKWSSARQAQLRQEELDRLVDERTAQLHSVIKALKSAKEFAETAALQDSLTKLPNRRMFESRLSLAIKHAERTPGYLCALLYLDVDRFKVINDNLGHLAGDELLIELAHILESCLRRSPDSGDRPSGEDIVARIGGDEFAIFLDNIRDVSDALRISDRISEKLKAPILLRGKETSITVSIGVALSASHYATADNMMRDADTAMYRAKVAGRDGCVLFDESMHIHAVERLHRESEMRQAIEQPEFFICYQPIVSLVDGKIQLFEALLRWRSPARGIVLPADFIPLAEETGLIVPIGAWVLREACLEICRWHQRFGAEACLSVGVNISSRQLWQPDFVALVKQTLHETGLDGQFLRLELAETVAMDSPERTAPMLAELQQLGVRISIDDFGTGYSSLKHLHRFSVDTLKIDRSFISHMEADERNLSIVRSIISLAHSLKMVVVAEGAETGEQLAMLSGMNCDCAQGHFLAKPMESAAVEEFLSATPGFRLPLAGSNGR